MRANDRSKVVGGSAHGEPGVGGAGGTYLLADDSRHSLNILSCRMLQDGYPDWYDNKLPRSVAALERALRTALAGNFPIMIEAPRDRERGTWRFIIKDRGSGEQVVLVSMQQGGHAEVRAAHVGQFSGSKAETCERLREAVDRVVAITIKQRLQATMSPSAEGSPAPGTGIGGPAEPRMN
ncbi:hypothetical protein [Sphingomonas sp. 3-13AW]|uniref:hypothetical protein n=1 Tax=Sphingomonas sp. 3-13AW TaxID=3050450 RepID=UPI003BB6F3E1